MLSEESYKLRVGLTEHNVLQQVVDLRVEDGLPVSFKLTSSEMNFATLGIGGPGGPGCLGWGTRF